MAKNYKKTLIYIFRGIKNSYNTNNNKDIYDINSLV